MSDRLSNAATASGDEAPIGLRGYLNVVGVAGIATMTAVGPASLAAYLRGGALLGPQMGWVVLMASLTMWVVLNMSNRTTCMTGTPPLQLLAEIWKPLALIGFFLWVVPQVFIVMVQGGALAQTASALTAVPAQFVVWPTLILVGVVFFAGTFKFVRSIAALLLTLLMITGLALAVRLLVGGELPMKDAFEGLIVPKWPGEGETTALVAGAIGGAGSWGFLAYQGYSVFGSRNARPERLRLVNLDSAVLGFGLFFLFSIGIFWAASGTFYGGDAPETAIDAADLFVPQLGEWSRYIFLAGFLGALLTTVAGTVIILVTSVFAVLDAYGIGGERSQPQMSNPVFKLSLWVALIFVAGGGAIVGQETILPALVWSLGLLAVASPPALLLWLYLTNSPRYVGSRRAGWFVNLVAVVVTVLICYLAIEAFPDLLSNPFG